MDPPWTVACGLCCAADFARVQIEEVDQVLDQLQGARKGNAGNTSPGGRYVLNPRRNLSCGGCMPAVMSNVWHDLITFCCCLQHNWIAPRTPNIWLAHNSDESKARK